MKSTIAFLPLLHLTTCFSLSTSTKNRRIYYGEKVTTKNPLIACLLYDEGDNDWFVRLEQVFFRDSDYYHLTCGGFIVSDYFVLTAAHCVTERRRVDFVGVGGLNIRDMAWYHKVERKIPHPDFVDYIADIPYKEDYDIGLVKTISSMTSLGLPTRFNPSNEYLLNHPIVLYGWGTTENNKTSEDLKQTNLKYDIDLCKNEPAVKEGRVLCFRNLKEKERGSYGDSGSPIMINAMNPKENNVILSVLGSGSNIGKTFYAVHGVNVTFYFDWMIETIKKNN